MPARSYKSLLTNSGKLLNIPSKISFYTAYLYYAHDSLSFNFNTTLSRLIIQNDTHLHLNCIPKSLYLNKSIPTFLGSTRSLSIKQE